MLNVHIIHSINKLAKHTDNVQMGSRLNGPNGYFICRPFKAHLNMRQANRVPAIKIGIGRCVFIFIYFLVVVDVCDRGRDVCPFLSHRIVNYITPEMGSKLAILRGQL